MTEIAIQQPHEEPSRIMTEADMKGITGTILLGISDEKWKEQAFARWEEVKQFVTNGVSMIQEFEKSTYQKHPEIYTDTDVIYIDSGPGPYGKHMLEPGKTDLGDVNYHQFTWSRNMDRARIRAAYALASIITARRIKDITGVKKGASDLTREDFEQYGPYLMYTSTDWQNSHIRHVISQLRNTKIRNKNNTETDEEVFRYPDSKIIMYDHFVSKTGNNMPIIHTEDQIEGLTFPKNPDGSVPRRVTIVSHPAHLMRITHILGKYPESIPNGTRLQLFPIPTPANALTEYMKAELLGTLGTVFRKDRATLVPFSNYEI